MERRRRPPLPSDNSLMNLVLKGIEFSITSRHHPPLFRNIITSILISLVSNASVRFSLMTIASRPCTPPVLVQRESVPTLRGKGEGEKRERERERENTPKSHEEPLLLGVSWTEK